MSSELLVLELLEVKNNGQSRLEVDLILIYFLIIILNSRNNLNFPLVVETKVFSQLLGLASIQQN